jgi:uncharacterized cupredoxin-like copper-binding protein
MPKKFAVAALLVAALTAGFGACGGGEDRPGSSSSSSGDGGSGSGTMEHESTLDTFAPAEAESTVDVVLKDFKIEMPATVKAGKVLFNVRNDGPTEHELVLKQGSKELIEVEGFDAGKTEQLAVVLKPGRYTAVCLIGSGGARHDKLGMVANFTVE